MVWEQAIVGKQCLTNILHLKLRKISIFKSKCIYFYQCSKVAFFFFFKLCPRKQNCMLCNCMVTQHGCKYLFLFLSFSSSWFLSFMSPLTTNVLKQCIDLMWFFRCFQKTRVPLEAKDQCSSSNISCFPWVWKAQGLLINIVLKGDHKYNENFTGDIRGFVFKLTALQ